MHPFNSEFLIITVSLSGTERLSIWPKLTKGSSFVEQIMSRRGFTLWGKLLLEAILLQNAGLKEVFLQITTQESNANVFLDKNSETFTNNEQLILEYFLTYQSGSPMWYYKWGDLCKS